MNRGLLSRGSNVFIGKEKKLSFYHAQWKAFLRLFPFRSFKGNVHDKPATFFNFPFFFIDFPLIYIIKIIFMSSTSRSNEWTEMRAGALVAGGRSAAVRSRTSQLAGRARIRPNGQGKRR